MPLPVRDAPRMPRHWPQPRLTAARRLADINGGSPVRSLGRARMGPDPVTSTTCRPDPRRPRARSGAIVDHKRRRQPKVGGLETTTPASAIGDPRGLMTGLPDSALGAHVLFHHSARPLVRALMQRVLQRLALHDPARVWHQLYATLHRSTDASYAPEDLTELVWNPLHLFQVNRVFIQHPAFLPLVTQVRLAVTGGVHAARRRTVQVQDERGGSEPAGRVAVQPS